MSNLSREIKIIRNNKRNYRNEKHDNKDKNAFNRLTKKKLTTSKLK